MLSQLSYTPTVIPAFVLLPFESTVSSTLKTIQCNSLKHEFVFYAALNRDMFTHVLLRKEVIQPHLPIRLPCYDFTPIIGPTFGSVLLAVRLLTSGIADSHGVTGGVYKARERIHGSMLTCHY